MQVKIRKGESATQTVKRGKKPLSYFIPICRKTVRIKKSPNQTREKKSSVILLQLLYSVLTFSDKRKHLKVLFWIIRAQTLNVCLMAKAVVLEHCLLANTHLGVNKQSAVSGTQKISSQPISRASSTKAPRIILIS